MISQLQVFVQLATSQTVKSLRALGDPIEVGSFKKAVSGDSWFWQMAAENDKFDGGADTPGFQTCLLILLGASC